MTTVEPAESLAGRVLHISGQIVEEPREEYGRYYYIIKTESIDGAQFAGGIKLQLSSKHSLEADAFDRFEGVVTFNSAQNQYGSVSYLSRLSQRIVATAYVDYDGEYTISEGQRSLYYYAIAVRRSCADAIEQLFDERTAALICGMILGDTSRMDIDLEEDFRAAGLSHLLAVSGLHMSIICTALTMALRRLHINRKVIAAAVLLFVTAFVAVTGFPASAMRAGIMTAITLLGVLLDRTADSLNSLGLSVLLICIADPFAAADIGLLLSFAATLGMITIAPKLNYKISSRLPKGKLNYLLGSLSSSFVTSLTGSLCTMPITCIAFGEISLIAPLVNLSVIAFASTMLVLALLATIIFLCGKVGAVAAVVPAACAWILAQAVMFIAHLAARLPYATITVEQNIAIAVVASCAAMLLFWFVLFGKARAFTRHHTRVYCIVMCVAIVFAGLGANALFFGHEDTITIHAAEDGLCITVGDLMIGAGGDDYQCHQIYSELRSGQTHQLSTLILPDCSERYAYNADTFISLMQPENIFIGGEGSFGAYVLDAAQDTGAQIFTGEYTCSPSDNCTVTIRSDASGLYWTQIECNGLIYLVCPDSGDCIAYPFEELPDIAVVTSSSVANISLFEPRAVVICADTADSGLYESYLQARSIENIYSTGIDGTLKISRNGVRINIDKEN